MLWIVLMASGMLLLFVFYFQLICYTEGAVNESGPTPVKSLPILNDSKLKVETVYEGLRLPTSMAFLGPSDVLVTEKNNGTIQRLKNWKIQQETWPQDILEVC